MSSYTFKWSPTNCGRLFIFLIARKTRVALEKRKHNKTRFSWPSLAAFVVSRSDRVAAAWQCDKMLPQPLRSRLQLLKIHIRQSRKKLLRDAIKIFSSKQFSWSKVTQICRSLALSRTHWLEREINARICQRRMSYAPNMPLRLRIDHFESIKSFGRPRSLACRDRLYHSPVVTEDLRRKQIITN